MLRQAQFQRVKFSGHVPPLAQGVLGSKDVPEVGLVFPLPEQFVPEVLVISQECGLGGVRSQEGLGQGAFKIDSR